MSFEEVAKGLIDALNRNAAAVEEANKLVGGNTTKTSTGTGSSSKTNTAAKTEKKAETDTKAADANVDKQPKVTEVQLIAKIKELAGAHGKETAREQFSDLGYDKMADIKAEDYDTVYDRCVAKLTGSDDL